MNQKNIGKLLPIDGFLTAFNGEVVASYFQSLTHLYQPLIGVNAIALYQTLLTDCQINSRHNNPQTHHLLMNYLTLPLDEIYSARLKLEGIGLLQTYLKQDEKENVVYVYQLQPPFQPVEFFNDAMLSQLLFHHLGQAKYDVTYQAFHHDQKNSRGVISNSSNVTANFNEVFRGKSPYTPTQNMTGDKLETSSARKGPNVEDKEIDFGFIEQMLSQRMIPSSRILTPTNKKVITQMVALYELTSQELEKIILWAINDEHVLNIEEFKQACLDITQTSNRKVDISLVDRKEKVVHQTENKNQSKEEKFIQMLEQISPRQLLEDLSGGNEASPQDLKVVSDVMSQQGLPPAVMNVLIHYVMLKTDMKLTKAYLEKIASHWARKKVKTVRQAMTLAKSESKKYQQWGNSKQSFYKKATTKEVIPDWFNERNQKQNEEPTRIDSSINNYSKEDIGERLKNYKQNKNANQSQR